MYVWNIILIKDRFSLNLVIVFRQKNLRTVPNLLVVSLALGDFLFVLFCVPFGAVAYSLEYYPFSTFYCRFENFIINLSLGVSVFSLLALSADRYKIIVKPFSSHANDPSIKLKTVVISIWLLSICLALPETIYSGELLYLTQQKKRIGQLVKHIKEIAIKLLRKDFLSEVGVKWST
jgi:hypothetical protein